MDGGRISEVIANHVLPLGMFSFLLYLPAVKHMQFPQTEPRKQ